MSTVPSAIFSCELKAYLFHQQKIEKCLNEIEAVIETICASSAQTAEVSTQVACDCCVALSDLVHKTQKFNKKSLALLKEVSELKQEPTFSSREIECITQVIAGKTLAQIGKDLNISESSAGFYLKIGKQRLYTLAKTSTRQDAQVSRENDR